MSTIDKVLDRDKNHVPIQGTVTSVINDDNSSTTLLANAATFTGEWVDVSGYNSLVVAVKTDQNGTFTIQFSPDGTNVDSTLTRYYRTDQIEAPHRFTITRQYVRITFTNDSGSDQTYLRLQTMFSDKAELNSPVDSVLAQDFDATVVRPTGYKDEVALGRRQGSTGWNKFGYNRDVDVGTEVVAAFGGTFPPLAAASTLSIVSASTDDDGDPAGSGANTIQIIGIDANREYQEEAVTLNGQTPVVTTTTWFGINRVRITLSGSGMVNAGLITVTAVTGGATQATIPAGEGVTQQCIFFTEANTSSLLDWVTLTTLKQSGANPVVTLKGWTYSAVTNTKCEKLDISIDTSIENRASLLPPLPVVIGEQTAFWLEATTDKADTIVNARFGLVQYKDVDA